MGTDSKARPSLSSRVTVETPPQDTCLTLSPPESEPVP